MLAASPTKPGRQMTDLERTTTFAYDAVENLINQTEPNGTLTTSVPNDYVTSYDYDVLDRLTTITDANGDKLTYAYGRPDHQRDRRAGQHGPYQAR